MVVYSLKALSDRQSCLFCKFQKSTKKQNKTKEQKKAANLNYHILIKKSQPILKRLIDLKRFSVWFTLGSEKETMFCDT